MRVFLLAGVKIILEEISIFILILWILHVEKPKLRLSFIINIGSKPKNILDKNEYVFLSLNKQFNISIFIFIKIVT